MSKRANVFYLEHVRVMQKDERVVYLSQLGRDVEQITNIPDKNMAFVLLGKGTSISDSAIRMLAESNVMVGFCGSGGSPVHAISEPIFLSPQDEYRPTEYMQAWAKRWFDDQERLQMAKDFLRQRLQWNLELHQQLHRFSMPAHHSQAFADGIDRSTSVTELLAHEAVYAKRLYAVLAEKNKINFKRDAGAAGRSKGAQLVNSFLDHGNYIAYGYAAAALHVLGISFAFPVLHGKTRRGGLVFDVADLIKDWLVMPLAFELGSKDTKDQAFRASLIETAFDHEALDRIITFVKSISQKVY